MSSYPSHNLLVTEVVSFIRLLTSPIGIYTNRTNRERWAIAFKRKGRTIYESNGRQFLSDSLHIVLLPKGCTYRWTCQDPGECILIEFDAEETFLEPFSFPINAAQHNQLLRHYDRIEQILLQKSPFYQFECKQELFSILLLLFKSSERKYNPSGKQTLLAPAMHLINTQYYNCELNNDLLAAACDVSTVYFRKTFTSVYGISPMKYLQNLRLDKAKAMLASDYGSITQIAESVGYSNLYHFSKMFKLYTGVCPRDYIAASNNLL